MEKALPIVKTITPRLRKRVLPDIVGGTFGMLQVVAQYASKPALGKTVYTVLVRCECGSEKIVDERSVRRGSTKSCGRCAMKTHGKSKSPLYAVWRSMLGRCNNPNHKAFCNYGGRGITVCDDWYSFENFQRDMGDPPFKGASLDRIDNNLGYSVNNCRWVNWTTQARNKRTNTWIIRAGVAKTLSEWVAESGLKYNTVLYRLRHGWDIEKALSAEPNFSNNIIGK